MYRLTPVHCPVQKGGALLLNEIASETFQAKKEQNDVNAFLTICQISVKLISNTLERNYFTISCHKRNFVQF